MKLLPGVYACKSLTRLPITALRLYDWLNREVGVVDAVRAVLRPEAVCFLCFGLVMVCRDWFIIALRLLLPIMLPSLLRVIL